VKQVKGKSCDCKTRKPKITNKVSVNGKNAKKGKLKAAKVEGKSNRIRARNILIAAAFYGTAKAALMRKVCKLKSKTLVSFLCLKMFSSEEFFRILKQSF